MAADFLHQLAAKSPLPFELLGKISLFVTSIPPTASAILATLHKAPTIWAPVSRSTIFRWFPKSSSGIPSFPRTRIRKAEKGGDFEVLLASVDHTDLDRSLRLPDGKGIVTLTRGDHSSHLERVCAELSEALKYAANDRQRAFLYACIESFRTGSLDTYRDVLRIWAQDKAPRVEHILVFWNRTATLTGYDPSLRVWWLLLTTRRLQCSPSWSRTRRGSSVGHLE